MIYKIKTPLIAFFLFRLSGIEFFLRIHLLQNQIESLKKSHKFLFTVLGQAQTYYLCRISFLLDCQLRFLVLMRSINSNRSGTCFRTNCWFHLYFQILSIVRQSCLIRNLRFVFIHKQSLLENSFFMHTINRILLLIFRPQKIPLRHLHRYIGIYFDTIGSTCHRYIQACLF